MRGLSKVLIGAGGALAVAATIYGWGVGLLYPCGPIDGVFRLSDCRIVARLERTEIEALLPLDHARVLVALRESGPEPVRPQRLSGLSLSDGAWHDEVELSGLPPDGAWLSAALSPDGQRVAVAMLYEPTRVIDRASGDVVASVDVSSAGAVGFDGPDRLMIDQGGISADVSPSRAARVFAVVDGEELASVEGTGTHPLYRQGLAGALSPDGTVLAQHVRTRKSSGVVAVRVVDANTTDGPGSLLVAPLSAWLPDGHTWPTLWFSPSGAHLAASFDSADVWGTQTSALVIWDVESREMVQRIPTHRAEWDQLIWLEAERQVVASRFDIDRRRSDIAIINY